MLGAYSLWGFEADSAGNNTPWLAASRQSGSRGCYICKIEGIITVATCTIDNVCKKSRFKIVLFFLQEKSSHRF